MSYLWLVSRPPRSGYFSEKFTTEQVPKSFSGRNDSLKPPVYRFSYSLLYGLEESKELRAFIRSVKK